MTETLKKFLSWTLSSEWAHKHYAVIGGFALGAWVQSMYWKQIDATLEAWGIPKGDWEMLLLLVIGVSGISASVCGTLCKPEDTGEKPGANAQ